MKTIFNFLKYHFGKPNDENSYHQMRSDYVFTNNINKVSVLNGILNPKYNITESEGILGSLKNTDVKKITTEIKKDGYYIFPNRISEKIIVDLKEFASNTPMHYLSVNNKKVKYSEETIKYKDSKAVSNRYQILNISNLSNNKTILEIVEDKNFFHIANEYLGSKPILDIITMWWSKSLENIENENKEILKSSSAQMFHFDMDRLKFLKFFIYLTDVDTNTGPHVYVRGSHNRLPVYIKGDGRYADELVSKHDEKNIVEITGKAGTIIAVDTRGLHKGKELLEKERLIFQIEFTNSLFGNPNMPEIPVKFKYNGNQKYFESYKYFFTK